MYKNRLFIWILCFLACLLINTTKDMDINELVVNNTEVNINIDTDTALKSKILEVNVRHITFNQNQQDPAVIISSHSDDNLIGFDKIENAIYSPIVLYIPVANSYNMVSDIYYTLGGNSYFVNFKGLCDAILNDKTLSELGIVKSDSKMADKKIVLNLPSSGTSYYDVVIDEIYCSLNDNKVPTAEEKIALKETVDALIEKSVVCNSVDEKIYNNDDCYNVFVAPEFYINSKIYSVNSTNPGAYTIVYFEKTIPISYDIFCKKGEIVNDIPLLDLVKTNFLSTSNFVSTTKYRTIYNEDVSGIFNRSYLCNQLDIAFP